MAQNNVFNHFSPLAQLSQSVLDLPTWHLTCPKKALLSSALFLATLFSCDVVNSVNLPSNKKDVSRAVSQY